VIDLPDALSHVLWIGGGPCVGKSTLARFLAGKYDLKIYDADWRHAYAHRDRPGGIAPGWDDLTMDERWLLPSPAELAERDIRNWTGLFRLIVEDLLALPATRTIVVDGKLFPWVVAPMLASSTRAIFLVPTPAWRDRVLARRLRDGGRFEDRTSDPERARRNVRERETLMNARITASCDELGLRCVRVDGSLDLDDSLAILEEQFRSHLPSTYNV